VRAALVALLLVGGIGGLVLALYAGVAQHSDAKAPTTTTAVQRSFKVIFQEGLTRAQMIDRVAYVARKADREAHLRVRLNGVKYAAATESARVPCFGRSRQANLEGFLFPSTYDFVAGTTSAALANGQLQTFCDQWRTVNLAYARSKNLTNMDVLTIASMIEKEAAAPNERRLVSAVIYNRLHQGMPLGIDATLRYGLHIPPTTSITNADLASSSPYNTRVHYGLPPTPISNPGLAAIQAAAHPAHVDYLYYARIPGTNRQYFTASASAFQQFLATHGYGPHG
jgi:uncharacterized YceG family protein